jgi:hypothetical protein
MKYDSSITTVTECEGSWSLQQRPAVLRKITIIYLHKIVFQIGFEKIKNLVMCSYVNVNNTVLYNVVADTHKNTRKFVLLEVTQKSYF